MPVEKPPIASAPAQSSAAELHRKLDVSRRELLDLTARNRLLHTPRRQSRTSSIEIIDERAEHVHRLLVIDGKAMSFDPAPDRPQSSEVKEPVLSAPRPSPSADSAEAFSDVDGSCDLDIEQPESASALPQPADACDSEQAARRSDDRLQTLLPSNLLQQRLLRAYYAARTFEEEQGVNVLYLALGFLKWIEADKTGGNAAKERHAPLLLIPVELQRPSAAARFRVRWNGEDLATNLSLQVKLKSEFRINLPDVDQALAEDEELAPAKYFNMVKAAVAGMSGWEVLENDIVLGFFSFSKLLMYRDLDPAAWPEAQALNRNALISELLGGVAAEIVAGDAPLCGDDDPIDALIDPANMTHVVDADSSQAIVVEEARRGRNLVIQGPPGTGKSQTIANIIAAAVKDGNRVLFVAEKIAALDVVRNRLANIGLGDMCLELHSNKARKAAVLEDIGRTLELERPVVGDVERTASQLRATRDRLNEHARSLHAPHHPSGVTAYQCLGQLIQLRSRGTPMIDFTLAECETWTAAQAQQRRTELAELAAYAGELGVPAQHAWRGARLAAIMPMDMERLRAKFGPASEALRAANAAIVSIGRALAQPDMLASACTMLAGRSLARTAERIAAAPAMDRAALAHDAWATHRTDIKQVVVTGSRIVEAKTRLSGTLAAVAWTSDLTSVRRDMAAHGDGLFRMLSSAYRRARNFLRGVLAPGAALSRSQADRLALMDAVLAVQADQRALAGLAETAQKAFGSFWKGEESDWAALRAIEHWEAESRADAQMPRDFRVIASRLGDARPLADAARRTTEAIDCAQALAHEVMSALEMDVAAAFGQAAKPAAAKSDEADVAGVALSELVARLGVWQAQPEGLSKWIAYRGRLDHARSAGLGELCDRLHDGRIAPALAEDFFDAAYHERLLKVLARSSPSLSSFDGLAHDRLREQFGDLDRQRIDLARAEVARAHWERIPRGAGVIGEVGVIRRELNKKRRHLPIRQLLKAAGHAVQAIKPVLMMSPMSIAQYIEPGSLEFDLLLIDEASQVRPVDALGAIARAKQIVVVGDDKQLPPTKFFTRELEGDEGEDVAAGEASATGDLESILGLCSAQNLPARMLRWHYRSRHHSLIAVSNREFYDNRLYVVPSPAERDATRGLRLRHLPDGVFDRGASATNRVEARAVADAVMRHARECPSLSLGVGAFSVQQRDAIIDELERLRREDPSAEAFFAMDRPEPFFVKNLENIQGDERDVIFISVGYARDARGGLTMNFGPLSNAGGERRLNVLITRAKLRCEVFTSILAGDIDLARATGRGPAAFKSFLDYAERGVLPAGSTDVRRDGLREQIAHSLREAGWQVEQGVGVAGFFIDLAVRAPSQPAGVHAAGIEIDGPGYAASRSARDRDRTQPFVLTDRGWRLHRVWSLDYFQRPQEQLAKLIAALGAPTPRDRGQSVRPSASTPTPAVEREPTPRRGTGDADDPIAVPYRQARVRVPSTREIPELPVGKLSEIIAQIVEVEGPIHGDEIAERLRQLWEASRLGPRMVRAIDAALEWAVRTKAIHRDGEFHERAPGAIVAVRDRSEAESATLRDPAMLPPAEIRAAVRAIVAANLGAQREEAITATARLLGFRATTAGMREAVDRQVAEMIESGGLTEDQGKLRVAP